MTRAALLLGKEVKAAHRAIPCLWLDFHAADGVSAVVLVFTERVSIDSRLVEVIIPVGVGCFAERTGPVAGHTARLV